MERHRTRSSPSVTSYLLVNFTKPDSKSYSVGPYITNFKEEAIDDIVTPNFKKMIQSGEIISNPCSYTCTSRSTAGSGFGSYTFDGGSPQYTLSGPLTANRLSGGSFIYPPSNLSETDLRFKSTLACLANVDKPYIETGEDILELKETLRFISAPLNGIQHGLAGLQAAYKRRSRQQASLSFSQWLSDNWLAYRFGFSPLVQSLHNIMSAIQDPPKDPPVIRRAHGRSFGSFYDSGVVTNGNNHTFSYTHSHELRYHSVIIYRINKPKYDWRWKYGLRSKDIPGAFWAKMPYSFLVDRVYDVSSMCSAISALSDPNVEILAASITRRESINKTAQLVGESVPGVAISATGETISNFTHNMSRSNWVPNSGDVVPVLNPSGLVSSATRVADTAALVLQRLL